MEIVFTNSLPIIFCQKHLGSLWPLFGLVIMFHLCIDCWKLNLLQHVQGQWITLNVIGTTANYQVIETHTQRNANDMSCVDLFRAVLCSRQCLGSSLCQCTQFAMSMLLLPITVCYPGAYATHDFDSKFQPEGKHSFLYFSPNTSYHYYILHMP